MNNSNGALNVIVGLILCISMLSGCSGGDKKTSCKNPETFGQAIGCGIAPKLFVNPAAPEALTAGNGEPTADQFVATVGGRIGSANTTQYGEFEPNNSLDNANVVALPIVSNNIRAGVEISGSLQSADNNVDYYIFTPNRSSSYNVFLCADTCADVLQDAAVRIMIYDQNQTTIDGTPIGSTATQILSANLTFGLAYYVQVHGYNTEQENYDYRLIIID